MFSCGQKLIGRLEIYREDHQYFQLLKAPIIWQSSIEMIHAKPKTLGKVQQSKSINKNRHFMSMAQDVKNNLYPSSNFNRNTEKKQLLSNSIFMTKKRQTIGSQQQRAATELFRKLDKSQNVQTQHQSPGNKRKMSESNRSRFHKTIYLGQSTINFQQHLNTDPTNPTVLHSIQTKRRPLLSKSSRPYISKMKKKSKVFESIQFKPIDPLIFIKHIEIYGGRISSRNMHTRNNTQITQLDESCAEIRYSFYPKKKKIDHKEKEGYWKPWDVEQVDMMNKSQNFFLQL